MKHKNILIAIILLCATLLSGCGKSATPIKDDEVDDKETTPIPTKEVIVDPWKAIRESGEEWLAYGLAAHESGKQVENLREFFSDRANMTYLTLYDHFFTYDKAKSVPVAEALFAFIYDEYGMEALLDLDKRCEYKSAYLKSLGSDLAYTNDPKVETFLASMDFSSNARYKYMISFDNVTYYFKDFGAGSPTQYHGFLYYSTTGLFEMIEYLKANNLSEGLDTEREFRYFMSLGELGYNKTVYESGDMYINDSYATLHEAVHAMGVGINKNDNIWLSEGLCNYFGKCLGFNDQIAASNIQILTMAKQGYFDEKADAGNLQYVLYKRVYEDYTAGGGKLDSVDTFDFRLYIDVAARAELDTEAYQTLGYAYKLVNNAECRAIGKELSYDQATSLVLYLVDTYGIEKVLTAYHTQDIESVLGKGYEALKTDWLAYLYN